MVPVAHVVVAFSADDGSLVAGESALELDTAEDLKLLQSRPVHISTNASVPVPPDR